jgi:hypothetical protein
VADGEEGGGGGGAGGEQDDMMQQCHKLGLQLLGRRGAINPDV